MAYLNWKSAPLEQNVEIVSDRSFILTLTFALSGWPAHSEALREALSEVVTPATSFPDLRPELRIDLPKNWILFLKTREGESRLLIAHPQPEEWVATAALGAEHASALLQALANARAGDTIALGSLAAEGGIGALSNLDLLISIEKDRI